MRVTKACRRPLFSIEVTQVLRRLVRGGVLAANRADQAIRDLLDLRIHRYPHFLLVTRIWQLRHNLSAYDAAYIALAESLKGALIPLDRRLASVTGHGATIELF